MPRDAGVHSEHAGRASQTQEQWRDEYSTDMLERSAFQHAKDAIALSIPPVHLTGDAVRTGRGFVGHWDISQAYGVTGGHWDPGPSFPWDWYLGRVAFYIEQITGTAPEQSEEDEVATKNTIIYHTTGEVQMYIGDTRIPLNKAKASGDAGHKENADRIAFWSYFCAVSDLRDSAAPAGESVQARDQRRAASKYFLEAYTERPYKFQP